MKVLVMVLVGLGLADCPEHGADVNGYGARWRGIVCWCGPGTTFIDDYRPITDHPVIRLQP